MLAVNAVYVAHYNKLTKRKERLLGQLEKNNIECQWFEQEPNDQDIENYYDSTKKSWETKNSKVGYSEYVPHKILNRAEKSLIHKHIKIYKDIVNNEIPHSLILEDDVIFCDNFVEKFNFNIYNTPRDWDFIFIGSGCNLRIDKNKIVNGKPAYLKEHPASKCTDSYVVKNESIKKILPTLKKYSFPIDFELNYQMALHDMKVYWWEPPIIYQGSQCGIFNSEIQK